MGKKNFHPSESKLKFQASSEKPKSDEKSRLSPEHPKSYQNPPIFGS
jgi:hypothetical protein